MKKLILSAVMLVCSMAMFAQGSFKSALGELLNVNSSGDFNKETISASLLGVTKQMADCDDETAKRLLEKYTSTQFYTDIVEVMEPYYSKYLTEAELQTLTKVYSAPEAKAAQANNKKVTANANNMQSVFEEAAKQILAGQTPADVTPVDCPASYKTLYDRYFELSNSSSTIDGLLGSLMSMLNQISDPDQKAKFQAFFDTYKGYCLKNIKSLSLNTSYGTLTEADLNFFIKVFSTPEGKKLVSATSEMSGDAVNLGMGIIGKYSEWLGAE